MADAGVHAFWSHGLIAMGFVYLLLVAGEFSTFYGQFYLTMMVAQYSLSDLRLALFNHVERLPMSFFDCTPTGRLVSRMTTDIDAITEMFSAARSPCSSTSTLLGSSRSCSPSRDPGAVVDLRHSSPADDPQFLRQPLARDLPRDPGAAGRAQRRPLESLAGMAVVQLFTREKRSREEFEALNLKSRDAQMGRRP